LACGFGVLFARLRFFCGMAGAMATEIGIPFAGVQFLCDGASGMASGVWIESAGVGPRFCGAGSVANISGVLSDFSGTATFFKDFVLLQVLQSPSSFWMSDTQEQHLNGKTWYDDRWSRY
jgi:hypothetical protein